MSEKATSSSNHPICHNCKHRTVQNNVVPGSWCYMFRDGTFLEEQGYCGQFRLDEFVFGVKPITSTTLVEKLYQEILSYSRHYPK